VLSALWLNEHWVWTMRRLDNCCYCISCSCMLWNCDCGRQVHASVVKIHSFAVVHRILRLDACPEARTTTSKSSQRSCDQRSQVYASGLCFLSTYKEEFPERSGPEQKWPHTGLSYPATRISKRANEQYGRPQSLQVGHPFSILAGLTDYHHIALLHLLRPTSVSSTVRTVVTLTRSSFRWRHWRSTFTTILVTSFVLRTAKVTKLSLLS
jgi:hypothetical protein